jgi:hypothetical protein
MPFTLSHIQQVPDMLLKWSEKGLSWEDLFGGWGEGNVQLFKGLTEVTNRLGAFSGAVMKRAMILSLLWPPWAFQTLGRRA